MKKVLFIPSWYPYPALPHAGNFILNQAKALAENGLAEICILNWGQLEYQLTLRSPLRSLARFKGYLFSKPELFERIDGIREYRIPHLSWTHYVLNGHLDTLIPKLQNLPRFDLIHAHVSYPAGYMAMKLSELTGTPYIITEHSGPFPLPGLSRKGQVLPIVQKPITKATAMIAVSTALQAEITNKTGISSVVIPNVVDCTFFQPAEQPRRARAEFTLFALSALTYSKGIGDLLDAMQLLKNEFVSPILYLGGSGPLESKLQRYLSANGMLQQVKLLGKLSPIQALDYYQTCDAFVMPSHHESFSVVLLEALACGKPVIATNCGGPADIVNIDNGLLVPSKDPDALASAIHMMMQTYSNYDQNLIRKACVANFSYPVVAKRIAEVYQSILI